jgi:hypothetical protein
MGRQARKNIPSESRTFKWFENLLLFITLAVIAFGGDCLAGNLYRKSAY